MRVKRNTRQITVKLPENTYKKLGTHAISNKSEVIRRLIENGITETNTTAQQPMMFDSVSGFKINKKASVESAMLITVSAVLFVFIVLAAIIVGTWKI